MTSTTPPPPWTIAYADGAANLYRLDAADDVAVEYVPVTPAQSSTGMYDGGPPWRQALAPGDARIDEVWRHLERLAADTAGHAAARIKGSGAFTVTTGAGTRHFIVNHGGGLAAFEAVLESLRR